MKNQEKEKAILEKLAFVLPKLTEKELEKVQISADTMVLLSEYREQKEKLA